MTAETELLLRRVERLAVAETVGAPLAMRRHDIELIGEAFEALIAGYLSRGEHLIETDDEAIARRLHAIGDERVSA